MDHQPEKAPTEESEAEEPKGIPVGEREFPRYFRVGTGPDTPTLTPD